MQSTEFFIDYDKLSAKFIAKGKGLWEQKKIMIKTNKTEGLNLSETKSYYKATLMQKKKKKIQPLWKRYEDKQPNGTKQRIQKELYHWRVIANLGENGEIFHKYC